MRQVKQNVTESKKNEVCGMKKEQMIEKKRKIHTRNNNNTESRKDVLKILMSGIPIGNKV